MSTRWLPIVGFEDRAIGEKYGVEYRTAFAAIKRETERRAEH